MSWVLLSLVVVALVVLLIVGVVVAVLVVVCASRATGARQPVLEHSAATGLPADARERGPSRPAVYA